MTAPTKGPYEPGKAHHNGNCWEACVYTSQNSTLATFYGETREEAEANAQLFAAAWELKKCAEEVAGTRDETIKAAPAMWLSQLVHMARAALAKADGTGVTHDR